jgi:hypothetical protein
MAQILGELGSTGLQRWSGTIHEDFLRELQGSRGYKKYNEMRLNSPVIGALLAAIEMSVRSVSWQFVSDYEDDERVEFLQDALNGLHPSFSDHIVEALTFLPFGWSWFEIVYRRDERGRLVWKTFAPRGQDTLDHWEFDKNGELLGLWQRAAPEYRLVFLPLEKCIHYKNRGEKRNPEGRSILRTAYKDYYYAKNLEQIEAIGVERDLAGLPVIKLPEVADTTDGKDSDATRANEIVRNLRQDEQAGVVLPSGWELELLSTGGSRQMDTDTIINRHESRMLMTALAQFLMLGQEGVGSLALSQDQTDLFTMSVNVVADIIEDALNDQAIPRLLRLNGYDPAGVEIDHSPAGDIDLSALGGFLQQVGSLITWTAADERWLRQAAKLPELSEEEIELERERKQEEALAIAGARFQQQEREQDQGDEMGAQVERYASGRAPDDDERRRWERRYDRLLRRFFMEQKGRVMKGVKRIGKP